MPEWRHVRLADLTRVITKGTTPTTLGAAFRDSGINFAKVESLLPSGRVDHSKLAYIDEETHLLLKRSVLEPNDILFSIAGTIGRVARVEPSDLPANTNQAVAIVRADTEVIDRDFLYYCLRETRRIRRAQTRVVQSVQQNLSLAELGNVEVPLPPLSEQRAIAATLGALDDKIESNRRLVELIPDLIRARILGAIDDGIEPVPVSSLASFVNGGAYTKGASGTGRMVIRIAELNGEPGGSTVYSDIDVPDDKTARPGDILMSWSGSLGVYRWARDEAIINQHIFKVIPSSYPPWLVFDRVDAVIGVFRAIARDKATTMGHIQRGHLDSTLVEVPAPAAVERLDDALQPMWQRLLVAERESLRIAALRDALLPELLSGRIRVPEAAAVVKDVADKEEGA